MKFIFKATPRPPPRLCSVLTDSTRQRGRRGPGRAVSEKDEICKVTQKERGGVGESSGAVGSTGVANK